MRCDLFQYGCVNYAIKLWKISPSNINKMQKLG
jgi:hypothetical protein